MDIAAIIVAVDDSYLLKSKHTVASHEILGQPIIKWVLDAVRSIEGLNAICVVSDPSDEVCDIVGDEACVVGCNLPFGSANAVAAALVSDPLREFEGTIIALGANIPCLTPEILCDAQARFRQSSSHLPMAFAASQDIRPGNVAFSKNGVMSGLYLFNAADFREAFRSYQGSVADTEDIFTTFAKKDDDGKDPDTLAENLIVVRSQADLCRARECLQRRANDKLMEQGVTIISPATTWIGPDVEIGRDVMIYPNCVLLGKTSVGEDSAIGPSSRLSNTRVGKGCKVEETIAIDAVIEDGATCGPRAYLRPGAHLMPGAKAGTHVEIKNSTIGEGSKVPHLSYIGDTTIERGVNIGAGSITCNYDGKAKHKTHIGEDTFIGSDTMMVAPVDIGSDVVIGAGSVITRDIPDGALAVARARETIKEGWVGRHRQS